MPITLTTLGTSLVAAVVEGNNAELERFLREAVVNGDIKENQFTRLQVKRYEAGRLVSAASQSLPILDDHQAHPQNSQGIYDLNYRLVDASQNRTAQISHTMELLGKPGPSMYWQFQEDALALGSDAAPDPNRYPEDLCYSNWLTVPNCSLRVYVPYPCVARIEASAYMLADATAVGKFLVNGPAGTEANRQANWDANYKTFGDQIAMQWALVADTNPELHSDEWANTNVNILDADGTTADYTSWKFVKQKKIATPLWQKESIGGSVILKGGRWYNFSLKFKGAGTLGYKSGGAGNDVTDNIWDLSGALANYAGGTYQTMAHIPPYEILWISAALNVEFIYGYGNIVTDTSQILTAPE